jgi:hypothetical protein
MKLPPDEIRVVGKRWGLLCRGDLIESQEAFGLTDIREQVIYYTDSVTPSQMRDTVIHELFHAIDMTIGLEMSEAQVHGMAAGVYAVLEDNPDFADWLLRR